MSKYRRVVFEVDAYQITPELAVAHLIDKQPLPKGLSLFSASYNEKERTVKYANFAVTTIHGQETAAYIGDWIITESDGMHHYPCKPEIFAATYEPV